MIPLNSWGLKVVYNVAAIFPTSFTGFFFIFSAHIGRVLKM